MNFDPWLVKRLTRPLKHPGVTNHQMAEGLIDRFQVLANRLPLMDQQLNRWSTIVELDAEQVPIVYAQSSELNDQIEDNFQSDLVGKKQELRSPILQSPKKIDLENTQTSEQASSVQALSVIPAIASSEQELSLVQIPQVQIPQNLDTTSIEQGLSIPAEPLATASILTKDLSQDLHPALPIKSQESLTDLPIASPSIEQTLTQITDRPEVPVVPISPLSNPPSPSSPESLSLAAHRSSDIALDRSSESLDQTPNPVSVQPISSVNVEYQTDYTGYSAQPEYVQTPVQVIVESQPEIIQPVISQTSISQPSATQPLISQPIVIQPVSDGVIQARLDPTVLNHLNDTGLISNQVSAKVTDVIASPIVTPIASEVNSALDAMPMRQQEISSSPTVLVEVVPVEDSITPVMAIASEIMPVVIDAVDMPTVQQAQREVSPSKVSSQSESPKQPPVAKSKQSKNKKRSPAPTTINNAEMSIHQPLTPRHSTIENQTVEGQTLANLTPANISTDSVVKAIVPEITPITIKTLSEPVIQAKEDVSTRASSPINLVSEPMGLTSAIASSDQELAFVQPQSSDAIVMVQGESIREAIATQKPLTQLADLPEISEISTVPIIPIANPPSPSSLEPLSFAPNQISETFESSEPSEQQLHPLTVHPINPVNTQDYEHFEYSDDSQTTVQVIAASQPEISQPAISQPLISQPEISQPLISQPLVIQPVSEGLIQARYDNTTANALPSVMPSIMPSVMPSIIPNTLPIPISNDLPSIEPNIIAVQPLVSTINDTPISRLEPLARLPEVVETPSIFSTSPQSPMPIVSAEPITPKLPPVSQTIQESSFIEQPNIELSIVQPRLITQNFSDRPEFITPTNSDRSNIAITNHPPTNTPIYPVTSLVVNSVASPISDSVINADSQQVLEYSPFITQIVPENVSTSNSALPLVVESTQDSPSIVTTPSHNSIRSSPTQSPIFPTVQAIVDIPEQTFEPLLLSRHNSHPSASEMTGNYPKQSYANTKVIATPTNTPAYPTANSSPPHHLSQQSTQSSSAHSSSTNHTHQNTNNVIKPPNISEVKEANPINMDVLVAQVERKIIKRLIVEGERRGKRKWL